MAKNEEKRERKKEEVENKYHGGTQIMHNSSYDTI